jgi:uncharacterized protein (DUF58 family)
MTRPAALTLLAVALMVAGAALPSLALFAAGCGLAFAAIGALVCVVAGARRVRITRRVPLREVEEGGSLSLFVSSSRSPWWPVRVDAWVGNEWRPMGRAEIRVDVLVGRRGSHELPPTPVRVSDPLGLADRLLGGGAPVGILALPRATADESVVRSLLKRDAGPDLEPGGLRSYVPGTQLSRIHWRSLARGGELVQRDLSPVPAEAAPLVVVDTHGGVDREAVDWAARTAAGAVPRVALARGCRVLLPGDRVPVHISSDLRGWPDVVRRLALLEATTRPSFPRDSSGSHVVSIRARDHRRQRARSVRTAVDLGADGA